MVSKIAACRTPDLRDAPRNANPSAATSSLLEIVHVDHSPELHDKSVAGVDQRVPHPGKGFGAQAFVSSQQPKVDPAPTGSTLRPRRPRLSRMTRWRTWVSMSLASATTWNLSATSTAPRRASRAALTQDADRSMVTWVSGPPDLGLLVQPGDGGGAGAAPGPEREGRRCRRRPRLSRTGARCWPLGRPVSPARSPHPACVSPRTGRSAPLPAGLSIVATFRRDG
jgi:hypothetical protein